MKWLVGLGNPGKEYARTRHNIGFMVIDRFAEKNGISVHRNQCKAIVGEGVVNGEKVFLIKPMTYMNASGEAVRAFMDYYMADIEDLIVIYDDLDMPFGSMRLRYKGSSGGHNGIKSLIQHLGTEQFKRLRMGISRPRPGADVAGYVLSPFTKEESDRLPLLLEKACDALLCALTEPFDKVMARFNGPV